MHRFDKLKVVPLVDDLTVEVYRLTRQFPTSEQFGLTSQVRRAAVFIGSNIAGGASYGTDATFARHLRIARGSLAEVQYQLSLSQKLRYLDEADVSKATRSTQTIRRMLNALITHLKIE